MTQRTITMYVAGKQLTKTISESESKALLTLARQTQKFLDWRPEQPRRKARSTRQRSAAPVAEHHFSPADLAEAWGFSTETVRVIFRDEPGVLRHGDTGSRNRRSYVTMRIPESVAVRVHKRLSAIPQ